MAETNQIDFSKFILEPTTTTTIDNNTTTKENNDGISFSNIEVPKKVVLDTASSSATNEIDFSKFVLKTPEENVDAIPVSNQPTTAEKIAYGIDKQNMFFGNVYRAGKAGLEALFDPDREFKEVMLEDTAREKAELFKRHQKFSTGLYDDDIEVLASEMATFMVDPYYIFMYATPWGRAMSMRQGSFKAAAKVAGLSAGAVSLDKLFDNLVKTGEANPKSVAEAGALAGVLGPASMKAFQIIGKLLPKADKGKIAQVVKVIEGKTQAQLGVTKGEFKILQKIAGDKEFLNLNKRIAVAGENYIKPIADKQKEFLDSVTKIDKKLAALRADKELIKSDVIGLIDKKKATKSISAKIIQIGKDEVIRTKAFDKAQKQLWESTAVSRKKITDLTSKRDVEFLEKLWKAKGLTEKTAQVLLSASVRPLMGAGIGWSLGALWGPEDTNLGTWMMVGASLGATHKAIQASKILPGQSKNLLQRIIYRDATKLSFQKARELTSTTTSSKLSAIGGETEQIGLQLLEGIDSSFAKFSVTQRADTLLRTWQKQAFDIVQQTPGKVYSQADQDLALAIVRGSKSKGNPAANQLAKRIENELTNFKKLYNDAGIFSLDDKGKLMDIEKYFPRVYDYDAITKDPKKFEEVIYNIFKSLGRSDKKAKEFTLKFTQSLKNSNPDDSLVNQQALVDLVNGIGKGNSKGLPPSILKSNPLSDHITNRRILEGPYAKVEKVLQQNGYLKTDIVNTLDNLYIRSMKSIAFAEKFGAKGELLQPYIKGIVQKYKATGRDDWSSLANKEINLTMKTIDAFFDRYGTKVSSNQKTVAGILSTIGNLNMLDRVTIASLGDVAQPFTNSNNFFSFFKGAIKTGMTNKSESGVARNMNLALSQEIKEGLLKSSGTAQAFDDATKAANVMGKMGVVRKLNEFGFKWMGLQWLTGLSRRYAYNVGAVDAYTSASKLAKFVSANGNVSLSSSKGLKLVRDVNRYSIDVKDALKLGSINSFDDAVANKATNKILNQSGILAANRDALVPQVSNRLLFTQSRNPWVRLMGQFTSWAMAKSTQTNKVLQRIENGDTKQLVKLLAALPVYGGIQMLREIAKYGEIKTDPATQEGKWWAEALRLSGMSGILPELAVGRTTGPGSRKPWYLPFPAATVLDDTGDIFKDVLKGNTDKAFQRFMLKIAPFPTWRNWAMKLFGGLERTQKFNDQSYESLDTFKKQVFASGGIVRKKYATGLDVTTNNEIENVSSTNEIDFSKFTLTKEPTILKEDDVYITGDNLNKTIKSTEEKIIEQKPMSVENAKKLPMKTNDLTGGKINWKFISEKEGAGKEQGYVPKDKNNKPDSNSGVTIGTGIDLKMKNRKYFEDLNIDEDIIKELEPFFGLKGIDADVKAKNLNLSTEQIAKLDLAVKKDYANRIKTQYEKDSGKRFENLTDAQQTVIISVAFQHGLNATKKYNFWKQATTGDWNSVEKNLRNFGDDYDTRRKDEADLLGGNK